MTLGPLFALLASCQTGTPSAPTASQLPHIVLITLDTTRADRLGAYGYKAAKTDTLDALANAGHRYSHAYSPAPLTIPSHISLFTGLYPPQHGVRSNGDGVLREKQHTLIRALKAHGYTTGAAVAAFVTSRSWGFHHGFDGFFDAIPKTKNAWLGERNAEAVIDDALAWLDDTGTDSPVFLWTHLYDPHFPHRAPEPYASALKPYDAELAYVDDQVARLVKRFEGLPTLFVVVGDHGEGLGEHGELGHGLFVYDATQRVPMFISGHGIEPKVFDSPVSLVDVFPTLFKHLGLPLPTGIDGHPAPHDAPLYMEAFMLEDRLQLAPHIGLVQGHTKLIDTPTPELYDLDTDPGEIKDLATDDGDRLAALKAQLKGLDYPGRGDTSQLHLDPDVAAQLEALGYMTGAEPSDAETAGRDPKDHLDLIQWSQKSERLLRLGKLEEADALLKKLLERYPNLVRPTTRRITALASLGRADEALALATTASARHPDDGSLTVIVANLHSKAGRWTEAALLYRKAVAQTPWAGQIKTRAVLSMLRAPGEQRAALDLAETYIEADPSNTILAGIVGLYFLKTDRVAKAMPLLAMGAKAAQPLRMVNFHLGAKAHQDGKMDLARDRLEAELKFHPSNFMAARLLKDVLVSRKDWAGMARLASRVLEAGPSAEWSRIKAQGYFNQADYKACRRVLDAALMDFPKDAQLVLLDANTLKKEGKVAASQARFQAAKAMYKKVGTP